MRSERFVCPSLGLSLSALMRRTRKVAFAALAGAVAAHLCVTQIKAAAQEQRAAKPLTTHFVKRAPRLTKPLELKKRAQPRRRQVQREMVAVTAKNRMLQTAPSFGVAGTLQAFTQPRVRVGRVSALAETGAEPSTVAWTIQTSKDIEQKIDMSLELLDIRALDTGRYHALVVQDPTDKRNITGFLNLAYIYSDRMTGMDAYKTSDMTFYGVTRLVDRMNEWTQIRTRLGGRFTFDSPELLRAPWVYTRAGYYAVGWKIPLSQALNLGQYLKKGGFWIPDGLQGGPGVGQDVSLRGAVKDALATVNHLYGRDWVFERLPFHHPVFHCFFEFPDGAPVSADSHTWGGYADNYPVEGVTFDGRLVVLYTNKNLILGWVGRSALYPQYDFDGTRVFQFGVNTIVFALTQEGSITRRLMDSLE